ncbi:hypothetical protein ColTof4_00835 [Colletotrichum tofieldiae]|nr:hypothetical protein ColTof3_08049 [Colletotrichum tofieldiae]GKT68412.1 hypothetical protein ColTof4_00835 [Colletotrichum tofieldiae]
MLGGSLGQLWEAWEGLEVGEPAPFGVRIGKVVSRLSLPLSERQKGLKVDVDEVVEMVEMVEVDEVERPPQVPPKSLARLPQTDQRSAQPRVQYAQTPDL